MKACELCGKSVEKFQRKYKGKGYCSTCYAYLFKKKACVQCGKAKRIYRYLQPPICQQCELKGQPCIRCGKTKFSIGKITEDGPVCNSCSKYYRPKQSCNICGKTEHNVSKRLKYGETEPICDKCFNKKHFVSCCRCKQRVAPFLFDFNRNAYCKPCATKPDKNCVKCKATLPAGHHSNTCYTCHSKAKIKRILKQQKNKVQHEILALYEGYAHWLTIRRDVIIASRKIIQDLEIFEFLDKWLLKENHWPTYGEYAEALSVQKTRQHLLATTFLNEYGIFQIDKKIKAEIGDLNTVERLMQKIPADSELKPYIQEYYEEMLSRHNQGKTSARAFRLAITPAVAMLELGLQQDKTIPDDELVKQYLWLHFGQRVAITGFINFLKNKTGLDIEPPNQDYFQFRRPKESRARIKQKLIAMLRSGDFNERLYTKTALEYFHNIHWPRELNGIDHFLTEQDNNFYRIKLLSMKCSIPRIEHLGYPPILQAKSSSELCAQISKKGF